MTSDYEGFPVVYVEASMFNLPVITTIDVTDEYINVKNIGVLVEKDDKEIYLAMKNFLENGITVNNNFSPQEFNNIILNKLNNCFLDND